MSKFAEMKANLAKKAAPAVATKPAAGPPPKAAPGRLPAKPTVAPRQAIAPRPAAVPKKKVIDAASAFTGLGEAKSRRNSSFLRPGTYILRVNRVKLDQNRTGQVFLAVEMTCLHVVQEDPGFKAHVPGEEVSHLLWQRHDSFLGNVRGAIAGIGGTSVDEVDDGDAVLVTSDAQPLANVIVEAQATNQITKSGGDFTVVSYRAIDEDEIVATLTEAELRRFFPDGSPAPVAQEEAPGDEEPNEEADPTQE